jgi:hypothetical protein
MIFVEPEYCRRLIAEFPAFDRKQALNELRPGRKESGF